MFEDANLEPNPNKNANTGHASAKVYMNGPQYETDIPVNINSNTSTNLSTTKYIESRVNIYVKNVFLSVFKTFKNLSKYFKVFHHFQINKYSHILSYKMAKNSSVLAKFD